MEILGKLASFFSDFCFYEFSTTFDYFFWGGASCKRAFLGSRRYVDSIVIELRLSFSPDPFGNLSWGEFLENRKTRGGFPLHWHAQGLFSPFFF